jgi:thiol-disulfide isomerase/thioredoxin
MTGVWLLSYIALWVLLLANAIVLILVIRNLGVLYDSLTTIAPVLSQGSDIKLRAGKVLPEVSWLTPSGARRAASEFSGRRFAFVFVSPGCGPCVDYLQVMARDGLASIDATANQFAVVSLADRESTVDLITSAGLPGDTTVLLDPNREQAQTWGISSTPTTVIVDDKLRFVRQVIGGPAGHANENGDDGNARSRDHRMELRQA